jgi:predicted amino acid-binding ACT domain protein
MALWNLRVELADRPGQLAALTSVVAAHDGNIVGIDVQAVDGHTVADELRVELGDDVSVEALDADIRGIGADLVTLAPADPHDLADAQARCLELARRLVQPHAATDRVLEAALVELVGADGAWVMGAEAAELSLLARRAVETGAPYMSRERTALSPTREHEPEPWLLVIPAGDGDAARVVLIARQVVGFTATEIARIQSLLRLAVELDGSRRLTP